MIGNTSNQISYGSVLYVLKTEMDNYEFFSIKLGKLTYTHFD